MDVAVIVVMAPGGLLQLTVARGPVLRSRARRPGTRTCRGRRRWRLGGRPQDWEEEQGEDDLGSLVGRRRQVSDARHGVLVALLTGACPWPGFCRARASEAWLGVCVSGCSGAAVMPHEACSA